MGVQCTYYNICFFIYFWLVPVFLMYLMKAPASFDSAPFYPVPIPTLQGDVPMLEMGAFPQAMSTNIEHCRPCKSDKMYKWDITLRVSYKDLLRQDLKKPVSTMYPVIFASSDAEHWKVVADADDVDRTGKEATHISAPLLVANLKNFGCVNDETGITDPFINQFPNKARATFYRWKLVEHVAMHGSVNLVACVLRGMDLVGQKIHAYVHGCIKGGGGEMKCHLSPKEALKDCKALGSACGQACGFFAPVSPLCMDDGTLDPSLFEGLTEHRVKIKTSPGGGGAAQSLVECSQDTCKKGYHFKNMYVEVDNPIEFLGNHEVGGGSKEKGSYYVLVLAMSDFHPEVHTYTVPKKKAHHTKDAHNSHHQHLHHGHHIHHPVHHVHHEEKEDKDNDKEKEVKKEASEADRKREEREKEQDEEEEKEENEAAEDEETRTCVDLPGVRLGQIDHADLAAYVKKDNMGDPAKCTAQCGKLADCKQAIFSTVNTGCYLFKLATVEVNDFDDAYNSSYCGPSADKELMMTMLHQAYKGYVPAKPPPALGPPGVAPPPVRRLGFLQGDNKPGKYYWQIAHVPNLTMGLLKDTGSDSVRVKPQNNSCFTSPGFVYMVACMTAKPVYMAGKNYKLEPPPFNDRCLAVGGRCGSSCGSATEAKDGVSDKCFSKSDDVRRLQAGGLLRSINIPKDMLVQDIKPRRSATQRSLGARIFFHLFIFFIAISYIATLLSKFPGNFTDFYPMHTWDEIHTHGYVLEKYGAAVACGCSAGEAKMTVLRNWIGKISSRPQFDDVAFPTFARWVDAFCDEGHREGARILWTAWTDFLDTNPSMDFLEQWSANLQNLSWDQAAERSPFDIRWNDGKGRRVLPVVAEQASKFLKDPDAEGQPLEGGVELEQDTLARLVELAEVFKVLPDNLKMEPSLPPRDDCILSRAVRLGLHSDDEGGSRCFTVAYGDTWQKEVDQKIKERVQQLGLKSKDEYEKTLMVTDLNGKAVSFFNGGIYNASQKQFPLHFREPPPRKDRQVIMIYIARAKPETDNKDIDKTRTLDKYLWACLRPNAVRRGKKKLRRSNSQESQHNTLGRSWTSPTSPEARRCVEGVLERQHQEFIESLTRDGSARRGLSVERHKEYALNYMKYRTLDSDWELARFCYGEIMGETRDKDGDEALILDNPSAALLGLISDSDARPGMALLNVQEGRGHRAGPVLVKKDLLMPYCGVRGKSGGLNYVVDLLQFREGFIGTGEENDHTPERMLFGIFDARHQPHPDFWRHTLPKFMNNTDLGYTYEVNEQVCMVQAPQTFALVAVEEDILDVLNGMTFNIMNVIRNRCGGVTSCGTNAVWQINAREFSRLNDESVTNEYFDSRTKIEDTASTHLQFCSGKRSVYVQEKISTGIAKLNSDYLCAMQRWAEGAVQLFWLQLFRDKTKQLVAFGLTVMLFLGAIYGALYGPWTKELIGFNLFCDVDGEVTLFTGSGERPLCNHLYSLFGTFLFHQIDKVMWEMAEASYMRLIDFAITWLFVCAGLAAFTVLLSWRGTMPKIVRVVIMMENISYWLTSCSIFFWVSLTLFMIIMMDPPLMFNVTHFMLFVLCLNITQHSMINEYKNMGGCDEASIWRSQQSYTLAAPLYVIAIVRGTASAWGIIWRRQDKSFWTSSDHGQDIVIGVTLWVTFIWAAFVISVSYTLWIAIRQWIFQEAGDNISKQCQIGALCMLGLLAITVWEPFLALWELNKSIDSASKDADSRPLLRWITGFFVWWRGRAWIMRYVIDFGMPILVLSGALGGGVSLITLATYATTVHGFRG